MSKTSTELSRHALSGPTMGTRWTALFFTRPGFDPDLVQAALQKAVDEVDAQMSTWNPDSDLMRLNQVPADETVVVAPDLARVLTEGLAIGRASSGAFDIGMGDAVQAWGFGPQPADVERIRTALAAQRCPAYEALEVTGNLVRKRVAITLDLNGIAKGYGVDRLAQTLRAHDITAALVGIDGEMRASGLRPDNEPWTIAVEVPDPDCRAPHSVLSLHDAAVATSGDYRHWVNVGGQRLSHTMDPRRGAPVQSTLASVTVIAPTCVQADAWATALMVAGPEAGATIVAREGISALFLLRNESGVISTRGVGRLFSEGSGGVAA